MMGRLSVPTAFLVVGLVLSLASPTRARMGGGGTYAVYPRVDATVMALEPHGLATIRTTNGTTYEVVQRPMWRVGDRLDCEHLVYARVPWERLDCRKVSG
jgi:hypothetical protein